MLDKFELIAKTFRREPTECIPYSLWKHFPEFDKTPEGLCKAQMEFQHKFQPDIMKISIHSRAFIADFGVKLGGYHPITGSRRIFTPFINNIEDWSDISAPDLNQGHLAQQITAMKLISKQVENEIPTMMTVFSPLMVASELDPHILEHYRTHPQLIKAKLTLLQNMLTDFMKLSLEAGADGIFLATQHFNNILDPKARRELEFQPMKEMINKSLGKTHFLILHLHGQNPDFKLATQLPRLSGINWHDRLTSPSLAEAARVFSGALLGGLNFDQWVNPNNNSQESIRHNISTVIFDNPPKGLIFSPGCVIPQQISNLQLHTVVKTIRNLKLSHF
jgi:uroporphyrinogen decarboxylase